MAAASATRAALTAVVTEAAAAGRRRKVRLKVMYIEPVIRPPHAQDKHIRVRNFKGC